MATARRLAGGHRSDLDVPVICVGNVTLGGSGKTPVVEALVRRLTALGHQPHILTRGYGGRLQGPERVLPQAHVAADVGDEALMLAAVSPVWVARDRAAGGRSAAGAGAEVVVMDDGLQNPGLRPALSILVVDGETRDGEWPFGDGWTFPAGPLREPLAAALGRVDAAVVVLPADLAAADPVLIAELGQVKVLIAHWAHGPVPPGRQLAFAGVGKPWRVERALLAAGCDLVDFAPLADHQPLENGLLEFLAARARSLDAGLLTTEKDWARLGEAWRGRVAPWRSWILFDDFGALDSLLSGLLRSGARQLGEAP